jgi:hypothetical protein
MQPASRPGLVELAPQSRNGSFDRIRRDRLIVSVERILDHLTAHDRARAAQQQFQQIGLAPGKADIPVPVVRDPRSRVEPEPTCFQYRPGAGTGAAQQSAYARGKFVDLHRLYDIVVRPGIEPGHAILKRTARRLDDCRRHLPALAPMSQPGDAVTIRQAEIEHDRIIGRTAHRSIRVGKAMGQVAGKPPAMETIRNQPCQPFIILDDKNTHLHGLS